MLSEAVDCEVAFAEDVLSGGVAGLSIRDMRQYLEYCADQRMVQLGHATALRVHATRSRSWTCRTCRN
jgi:ribonucleotide reductase beta subunit family protein with ferritin-like domain